MRRGRVIALAAATALAACTSPEASRDRGQPGADPGNRPQVLEIHGRIDTSFDTPDVGKAAAQKAVSGKTESAR